MKVLFGIFIAVLFLVVCVPAVHAQVPVAAGRSTVAHLEAGYSYFNVSIPGLQRIGMNGADAGLTFDLLPRLGIEGSVAYGRTTGVLNTGHPSDFLSYMAGPVFYPWESKNFTVRAHFLLGGARQVGVNTNGQGGLLTGFVNKAAWAGGGGLEYKLDRNWSFRFSADYIHSSFFNPAKRAEGQNNLRTGVGIVYTFGASYRR